METMFTLPILSYHGIESLEGEYFWQDAEKPYILSLTTFVRQMDFLSQKGFTPLSLTEMDAWLEGRQIFERPIVLTFDDAHLSHYEHIVPVLKRKGFKGIFFIPAGLIAQKERMSWSQLKEIVQAGFDIGSHGLRHVPLSDLTHHELWKELEQSKRELEKRLQIEVKGFSLPRGYYQLRIREVAMELGYRFLFTSRFDANKRGQDCWRLNRLVVKRNTSFETFSRMIAGNLGYVRIFERFKDTARRFLKPSFYDGLAELKRALTDG